MERMHDCDDDKSSLGLRMGKINQSANDRMKLSIKRPSLDRMALTLFQKGEVTLLDPGDV